MATSRVREEFGISEADMEDLVKAMAGPGANDVMQDVVTLALNDANWSNIANVAKVVAYQGFDPKKMALAVLGKLVNYTDQTLFEVTVDGIKCTYTDTATTLDVPFLITLFLVRGNSVSKLLMTTDETLRAIFSRKCSNVGISTAKPIPNQKMSSTTVTLARLSQAFPQVTAAIIVKHNIEGKLKPKWILGSTLPYLMQHSIFSALISNNLSCSDQLVMIAVALNLETTVMLQIPKEKRKMESRDMEELEEMSQKFVNAARQGTVCSAVIQDNILKRAGIITAEGAMTPEVAVISAVCSRFLSMKEKTYEEAVAALSKLAPVKAVTPTEGDNTGGDDDDQQPPGGGAAAQGPTPISRTQQTPGTTRRLN